MAYDKKLVSKAKKLFERGFTAPQIFDEVRGKISLRTLHRWVAKWKGESNSEREQTTKETQEILRESKELEVKAKEVESKEPIDPLSKIFEHLPLLTANIVSESQDIKNRIKHKLFKELEQEDVNTRAVTALSQSLSRHTEILMSATGMKFYIDANAAFDKIKRLGFEVIDPNAPPEEESDSGGVDYAEHQEFSLKMTKNILRENFKVKEEDRVNSLGLHIENLNALIMNARRDDIAVARVTTYTSTIDKKDIQIVYMGLKKRYFQPFSTFPGLEKVFTDSLNCTFYNHRA